ncbi:hypothetical protein BRC86_07520 [Halobacteriales archaeon QS_3_64_16]|nr:MAG: hypothetical protein BRC86_07520 [Halobacteriales archaeon QS_3_64_16]
MDRAVVLRALKAGIAGTAVLSVLLLGLEVQTRSRVRVAEVVVAYVGIPGQQSLALLVFVLLTAVVWPLAFVALESRDLLPGRTRTRRAVIFALALALAFAITGRGDLSGPVLVLYGAAVLGAYVAYGLTLARMLRPLA